jgi:hypothetical protein
MMRLRDLVDRVRTAIGLGSGVSANGEDTIRSAADLARAFTTPCNTSPIKHDKLMKLVRRFSREELQRAFRHDPFLANYVVSHWEFAAGETVLTTYPWKVVIPISDVCNATCTFCNSWLRGVRTLNLADVERFAPLLRHAAEIGLEGHGEPLIHPQIEALIQRLTELVDRRCWKYLITNGARLGHCFDLLQKLDINNYSISLNAATAKTHEAIMGLGPDALPRIVESIERLIGIRNERRRTNPGREAMQIYITFVVVNQNLHEVPSFIELANRLDVTAVWLRTLLPQSGLLQGLNYHLLPPYEHPEFEKLRERALAAIQESKVKVVADVPSWSAPIFPLEVVHKIRTSPPIVISKAEAKKHDRPDLTPLQGDEMRHRRGQKLTHAPPDEGAATENFFNRGPGYMCSDVYSIWHWNDFLNIIRPCCYMERPPGYEYLHYDGTYDFFEAWNSPAFVEIRRALRDGPLISWCQRCPAQTQYT